MLAEVIIAPFKYGDLALDVMRDLRAGAARQKAEVLARWLADRLGADFPEFKRRFAGIDPLKFQPAIGTTDEIAEAAP